MILITTDEAAARVGQAPATFRRWGIAVFSAVRTGSRSPLRWPEDEVQHYLEAVISGQPHALAVERVRRYRQRARRITHA